uniref:LAM_G_DOMAIN domain-containing protein n=1 Tax=Mesocestoides corti TaxID=53468 RepID=A0A5K3FM27_MESCO
MISPSCLAVPAHYADVLLKDKEYISVNLSNEFVETSVNGNTLSIRVRVCPNEGGREIKAIYGDGVEEPEIYVENDDWHQFNVADYAKLRSKASLLVATIGVEFGKELQRYFGLSFIPDGFVDFCLNKGSGATIIIDNDSNLHTFFPLDGYGVEYIFERKPNPMISLNISNHDLHQQFSVKVCWSVQFDPIEFANSRILAMKEASELFDDVLRVLSNQYGCGANDDDPDPYFLINNTRQCFRAKLDTKTFANIVISKFKVHGDKVGQKVFPLSDLKFGDLINYIETA